MMKVFARRATVFALILSSTCTFTAANATTVERFDLRQLTENAFCIFNGVCRSAEGVVVDGRITTRYVFVVEQVLKGSVDGEEIQFSFPGGVVSPARSHIVGMPEFEAGEETVLFLTHPDRNGTAWPVGLAQGKFLVDRNAGGATPPQVFQSAASSSLSLLSPAAKITSNSLPTVPEVGMPLSEFLSAISLLVSGSGPSGSQE